VKESKAVGVFGQHVVGLLLQDERRENLNLVTTFVVSVSDIWFLVTAGHVLADVQRDRSGEIKGRLIDSTGLEPKYGMAIPFDFDSASPIIFGDDTSFDYAVIPLRPYYRSLLTKNGIVPLDERAWAKPPLNPDYYLLAGFPSELVDVPQTPQDWDDLVVCCTAHSLEQLPDAPHGFGEKTGPRAYFRIALGSDLESILGLSGSPVFALSGNESALRYWLVGVQSSWVRSSRSIAVCPVQPLLGYLQDRLRNLPTDLSK